MEEGKVSFIGDYLGTIEEFMPGAGTYVDEGKIYASYIGRSVIDRSSHKVLVEGNHPPELKVGDVVFGEVVAIKKNMVTVIVKRIKGRNHEVDIRTSIYVSNISDSYTENPDDAFSIGDIVMGRVVKIDPGFIDISTKGEFGIIKAFCKSCRSELKPAQDKAGVMECPTCLRKDKRQIAKSYGSLHEI